MTDLVADIGGTNARVAFYANGVLGDPHLRRTADFPSLIALLRDVIAHAGVQPRRAALAVAGPVTGDAIKLTNLAWTFSARALAQDLGVETLLLENDVAAVAWSVPVTSDLVVIRAGEPARAAKLVLAPGTGLGMAALVPTDDGGWTVLSSEGGHAYAGVSPAMENRVAAEIWRDDVRLTWEDLLSGQGLLLVYRRTTNQPRAATPAEVTALAHTKDPAALAAVTRYATLLGACAGDMALIFGARGGCYLAGGVVPALGDLFRADAYDAGFTGKGAFAPYLAPIPTFLMTDPYAALRGLCALLDRPVTARAASL